MWMLAKRLQLLKEFTIYSPWKEENVFQPDTAMYKKTVDFMSSMSANQYKHQT